ALSGLGLTNPRGLINSRVLPSTASSSREPRACARGQSLGASPYGFESRHQHPRFWTNLDSATMTDHVLSYLRGLRVAHRYSEREPGSVYALRLFVCAAASDARDDPPRSPGRCRSVRGRGARGCRRMVGPKSESAERRLAPRFLDTALRRAHRYSGA